MTDQLAKLYQSINRRGKTALLNGRPELDHFLQAGVKDNRYGLTLLAHLSPHVGRNIKFCLQSFSAVAPNQYYYPSANMHITVMDILAAKAGFQLSNADFEEYRQAIGKLVQEIPAIHIQLRGLIVSPGALMVKGYYSPELASLRRQIRQSLPAQGLTLTERYPTYSGHVTVARFRYPLTNPANFLQLIDENQELEFGSFTIRSLDLVVHDWYNQ